MSNPAKVWPRINNHNRNNNGSKNNKGIELTTIIDYHCCATMTPGHAGCPLPSRKATDIEMRIRCSEKINTVFYQKPERGTDHSSARRVEEKFLEFHLHASPARSR